MSKKISIVAGAKGVLVKLVCDALLSRAQAAGQPLLVRGLVREGGANMTSYASEGIGAAFRVCVLERR